MTKRFIFIAFVFVLVILLMPCAQADEDVQTVWSMEVARLHQFHPVSEHESGKNTINLYLNYPPYTFGSTEDPKGLYHAIIKATLERMNAKTIAIKLRPWAQALQLAKENKGMIGGVFKTPHRASLFDFSHYFYTEEMMAYVLEDKLFDLKDLAGFIGKRIGLVQGWSYGEAIDFLARSGKSTLVYSADNLENFDNLIDEKVDVIVSDRVSAEMIIYELDLKESVVMLDYPIHAGRIYLAAPKKAGMSSFLSKFNEALDDLKLTGDYQRIVWEEIAKERARRIDAIKRAAQMADDSQREEKPTEKKLNIQMRHR